MQRQWLSAFTAVILTLGCLLTYQSAFAAPTLVSTTAGGSSGTANNGSSESTHPSISDDGNSVVFQSKADNLVFTDDGFQDIFLWSPLTGNTLISTRPTNDPNSGNSLNPVISSDGSAVAYESFARNLVSDPNVTNNFNPQIYVNQQGTNKLVSVNYNIDNNGTNNGGNGTSSNASISSNGDFVVFQSQATNLVDPMDVNDVNGGTSDIFMADVTQTPAEITVLSKSTAGNQTANGTSSNAKISGNGQCVVFVSTANNLDGSVTESSDGGGIFDEDVFLWQNGTITMISKSLTNGGNGGNGASNNPVISDDCSTIAFESLASDLVPESDGSGSKDVFVWTQATGVILVSNTGTASGNSDSMNPSISGDGKKMVFESGASNLALAPGYTDGNFSKDIFLVDITDPFAPVRTIVSVKNNTTQSASSDSQNPKISKNGLFVAFQSTSTDIVDGITDGNGSSTSDIFVRSLVDGITFPLSLHKNAAAETITKTGDGASLNPQVAGTGFVAFESNATDLIDVGNDVNGTDTDIFRGEPGGVLQFSAAEYSVDENDATGKVTITVTRTLGFGGEISVDYATQDDSADGSDYDNTVTDKLTWAPGDFSDKTFDVSITNDNNPEQDEIFKVVLSNPSGGAVIGAKNPSNVKIKDDDVPMEDCSNSQDDDGDNLVDCNDHDDCDGDSNCIESNCSDGLDDDNDGDADCQDSDCTNDPSCGNESGSCNDGLDNDNDGIADCQDSDCSSDPSCVGIEICNDGIDNDNDGLVDCNDTNCFGTLACAEECGDGLDNNNNGFVDCFDLYCLSDVSCVGIVFPTGEDCATPGDEDNDGLADCADPECAGQGNCPAAGMENCSTPGDEDNNGDADCFDMACAQASECVGSQSQAETCNDGVDNDGDGQMDCNDPDCANDPSCQSGNPEICDDPADSDEDMDGLINCFDPDCANDPACAPAANEVCNDGVDNDGDNQADCMDPDCANDPACQSGNPEICDDPADSDEDMDGLINCFDPDCANDPACAPAANEVCNDGVDNDGDGQMDCNDPDCANDPACAPAANEVCNDGVDNDGDGQVDCMDPDCANDPACAPAANEVCNDGVDNDGDGQVDCMDPDCANDPACAPAANEVCNDGVDNDGDNQVDCMDPDCANDPACAPAANEVCNDGVDNDGDGQVDCMDADCANDPVCVSPNEDDDGDGVENAVDNCPQDANPNQADADNDKVGDVCDATPNGAGNGGNQGGSPGTGEAPGEGGGSESGGFGPNGETLLGSGCSLQAVNAASANSGGLWILALLGMGLPMLRRSTAKNK